MATSAAIALIGAGLGAILAGCRTVPQSSDADAPAPPDIEIHAASDDTAHAIVGFDREAVQTLLGEPGLVWGEAPAEVWQYRTAACVVDLFLYEQETNGPRVHYVEARTPAADPAPIELCLDAIISRQAEPVPAVEETVEEAGPDPDISNL